MIKYIFVQMKCNKFTYLYSKPLGNHTVKIMKKIPGNLLKKTWKNHGNIMEFCQFKKVGTLQLTCNSRKTVVSSSRNYVRFNGLRNACLR